MIAFHFGADGPVAVAPHASRQIDPNGSGKDRASLYCIWINRDLRSNVPARSSRSSAGPIPTAAASLGAILVGYYDARGNLCCAGRVGTGFTRTVLRNLRSRLEQLAVETAPTTDIAAAALRRSHWVKPEPVAEIHFTEWPQDRWLRHPVFPGLRADKQGREVVL